MKRVRTYEQFLKAPGVTLHKDVFRMEGEPAGTGVHACHCGNEISDPDPSLGWRDWMFDNKEDSFDKIYRILKHQ